jgi:hypothetical protein
MGATSKQFGLALKGRFAMSNATSSRTSRSTKQTIVPFVVADISALAKSLRAAFDGVDASPSQVQMLNWLAKAAGHQNYQSLRAQASVAPNPIDTANSTAETAKTAKPAAGKATKSESETVLSVHAAKALTQFDVDGKLARWPYKFAVQRIAMWGLWIRFDSKRRYTEKEVNSVLNAWHLYGDHATLRRELINMDLLARKPDCSVYWKRPQVPSDEVRAFLRGLRGSSTV